MNASDIVRSALRTVEIERAGLGALEQALRGALADPFNAAVETCRGISGRVIVTGVGKSGHIGSKLAATFASTGTPAFFVHPAEANHGDLGMIAPDDVIIAMSWSGENTEFQGILAYSRRFSIPLIAITSNAASTLAREADLCLELPREEEACPNGLAPTTSAMMMLAIGDALAVALLESRGFSASDFRIFHPGGQLGANLTLVRDIMHGGGEMPLASPDTAMSEAILVISQKGFGCVGIVDDDGRLVGIITDGDLRRNMANDMLQMAAGDVMTAGPKTVRPETLASAAIALINESAITTLFVTEDDRPVGILHMHDLLRIGVA